MKKNKKNTPQSKINEDVERILEDIDAKLLSRLLSEMLIDYLLFNKDALPIDFDVSLHQLSVLFKVSRFSAFDLKKSSTSSQDNCSPYNVLMVF